MGNNVCGSCLTLGNFGPKSIKVITLNYGGVLNNPFEFYSDDQTKEKKLSETFLSLLSTYSLKSSGKDFQWKVGKIDQNLQAERYSPLYNPKVGIDEKRKKFINCQQFKKYWDQYFQQGSKKKHIESKKEQIQMMKIFDLLSYHAILVHLYDISSKQTLEKIDLNKLNVSKYENYMKMKFSKSFLNEEQKLNKVYKMLKKIDVAFFQETTQKLIDRLKDDSRFIIKHNGPGNCMIVLSKNKFQNGNKDVKLDSIQYLQKKDKLRFSENEDIVYLCHNKTIYISAHLSSKKEKNIKQVAAMKIFLNQLIQKFKDYHVILGADANSYVSQTDLQQKYSRKPSQQSAVTTCKKRTFLQPQLKKAGEAIKQCKDHIITTLTVMESSVETIDMRKATGEIFLPSDQHPFDHFMVRCQLLLEQKSQQSGTKPLKKTALQK